MRLILFGVGKFLANRFEQIRENDEIVAFVDNRAKEIQMVLGRKVILPSEINNYTFDVVIIMANDDYWIRKQLLIEEVDPDKIWSFQRYLTECQYTGFHVEYTPEKTKKESALLISDVLYHNGGAIAAYNACVALKNAGYEVWVCSKSIDKKILEEFCASDIGVLKYPSLPYLRQDDMFWIRRFDVVIVNTFLMIKCACDIGKERPVIWWLHEPSKHVSFFYERTLNEFWQYGKPLRMLDNRCQVLAVSDIAKKAFEEYFPDRVNGILTLGINDLASDSNRKRQQEGVIYFALVGVWEPWKGQQLLVNAAEELSQDMKTKSHFTFVGDSLGKKYGNEIIESISGNSLFSVREPMDRDSLMKFYDDVDVIVCASLEETLSLTIIEGLMLGKVCIVSDNTGVANYISDGKNGFVFRAGDSKSLGEKIEFVVNHIDNLGTVRDNARMTYEKYFSFENFSENLLSAVRSVKGLNCNYTEGFKEHLLKAPIVKNKIMFDCFEGRGIGDNGKYISLMLAKKRPDIDIVWNVRDENEIVPSGMRMVKRFTREYYEELYSSHVLVCNDGTFEEDLVKKDGQFIIDTWHGTGPFKKVFASIDSKKANKSYLRWVKDTFGRADVFISNSSDNTEMYRDSMLFEGPILEMGYPRNDLLFNSSFDVDGLKKKLGVIDGSTVILYAPTFRDNVERGILEDNELKELQQAFEIRFKRSCTWLVRRHHAMKTTSMCNVKKLGNVLDVSEFPDVMQLLLISDVLVTDYSSIMWDFSLMKRPVFLFQSDLSDYISEREFYLPVQHWPYPRAERIKDLKDRILQFNEKDYLKKLDYFFKNDPSYDDGKASRRLVDYIIGLVDG